MSPSKLFTQIAFGWWFLVFSLLLPTEISMKTMVENVTKTTLNTQVHRSPKIRFGNSPCLNMWQLIWLRGKKKKKLTYVHFTRSHEFHQISPYRDATLLLTHCSCSDCLTSVASRILGYYPSITHLLHFGTTNIVLLHFMEVL